MKKLVIDFFKNLVRLSFMGGLIGLVIGVYQLLCQLVMKASTYLFRSKEAVIIIFLVSGIILLAYISNKLIKFDSTIGGSGIPQLEINIRQKLDNIKWYRSGPLMIINSLISFFVGFALGSEGPSVFLGGNVGLLSNEVFKDDDEDLVAISAGSGFGCAFLSPLAGFCYIFEESLHHFSFKLVIKALYVAFLSFFVSRLINSHHLIAIDITTTFDFKYYYLIPFLIVCNVIAATFFVFVLLKIKDFISAHKNNFFIKNKIYIGFIVASLISFSFFDYSFGGGNIIHNILNYKSLQVIILLLIFRFCYTIFSANSQATGGLVVPMLTIGGILGLLISQVSIQYFGMAEELTSIVVLISMLTFFGVVTKTPFTALVIVLSTAGFEHLDTIILPAALVIFISYFISKWMKIDCLYEYLIHRLQKEEIKDLSAKQN